MGYTVNFLGEECTVMFTKYANNNRIAIRLEFINEYGAPEHMGIATVNLSDYPIKSDEVIIKDYSENEGIYDILIDAGIIEPANRFVDSGFVSCPVCKLKVPINE